MQHHLPYIGENNIFHFTHKGEKTCLTLHQALNSFY